MTNKTSTLLLIAGACGLIASYAITNSLASNHDRIVSTEDMRSVVIAIGNQPAGIRLKPEMLTVVDRPVRDLSDGTFSDSTEVTGQTLRVPIFTGEPIIQDKLGWVTCQVAQNLPKGMRAGTVRVDEEEARLAGLVKPGDHVDLMWLYSIPDTDDVKITTLLQNITVLAVGQTVQLQDPNQASPNQANQSNNAKEQNYTLLLTTQQYQKLALASSRGKIRLALRGKDDETTDEIGAISIRTLIPGMEPTSTDTLDLPHEREEFTIEYINAGGSRTEMIETPRRTHSHSHD